MRKYSEKPLTLATVSLVVFFSMLPLGSTQTQNRGVVIFTFDDGFATDYTTVLPIFLDRGVWGTSYIALQNIIPSGYTIFDFMDTSMLRDLADSGWDVQSGSFSHTDLTLSESIVGCPNGHYVSMASDARIGPGAGLRFIHPTQTMDRSVLWKDGEGNLLLDWKIPVDWCDVEVVLSPAGRQLEFMRVTEWFEMQGFPYPHHFAFPFGAFNSHMVDVALQYHLTYRVTVATAGYNYAALGENKLVGWVADDKLTTQEGIAEIKQRVDKVVREDWLLVLVFHEVPDGSMSGLAEVLDYAIQESDVMSVSEYWEVYG